MAVGHVRWLEHVPKGCIIWDSVLWLGYAYCTSANSPLQVVGNCRNADQVFSLVALKVHLYVSEPVKNPIKGNAILLNKLIVRKFPAIIIITLVLNKTKMFL